MTSILVILLPVILSVNNSLYCNAIERFGTEKQKEKFLTPVASGEAIAAYSLTEPMSGSDAGTMRSRAVLDGDSYVINGRKSWVSSGPVAKFILMFTMTDPEQAHQGVTAFLVEPGLPGFSLGKTEPKLGIRASATCEILFEDYRCPVENRLGEEWNEILAEEDELTLLESQELIADYELLKQFDVLFELSEGEGRQL